MNNLDTSFQALKRGKNWHQSAIRALEDQRWDDVIYSYQMAVEQSMKAILILFCIEYPKKHDISKIYLELKALSLPEWFLNKIELHSEIIKDLVRLRGTSAYGYVDGITSDDFFDDALKFKESVKEIIEDCEKLIIEFKKEQESKKNKDDSNNLERPENNHSNGSG